MLTISEKDFLDRAARAAKDAGVLYPEFQACEAAEESRFGNSALARIGNNLFGRKQSVTHPVYETIYMPGWEIINGQRVNNAHVAWVKYPDWGTCFHDRVDLLHRLSTQYPNYAKALASLTGEDFVTNVSKTWSTDPKRAALCLAYYDAYFKPAVERQTVEA